MWNDTLTEEYEEQIMTAPTGAHNSQPPKNRIRSQLNSTHYFNPTPKILHNPQQLPATPLSHYISCIDNVYGVVKKIFLLCQFHSKAVLVNDHDPGWLAG